VVEPTRTSACNGRSRLLRNFTINFEPPMQQRARPPRCPAALIELQAEGSSRRVDPQYQAFCTVVARKLIGAQNDCEALALFDRRDYVRADEPGNTRFVYSDRETAGHHLPGAVSYPGALLRDWPLALGTFQPATQAWSRRVTQPAVGLRGSERS